MTRVHTLPPVPRNVLARNVKLSRAWLAWLEAHGRSRLTVYQYGGKMEAFLGFVGTRPLDDVTLADLEAFVSRPRGGKAYGALGADSTRARDVITLRGFFTWATKHGHLANNPAADLELPRVKNDNPKAIPAETWRQFWLSPLLDDEERVAFGLGFFCGLRREEMCRLSPQHVDLNLGRIQDFPRKGDRNNKTSGNVPVVSLARLFAQEQPKLLPDADAFLAPLKALCVDRAGSDWLLPWGERAARMPQAGRGGPLGAPYKGGERPVPRGMTSPDQINHRLFYALRRMEMPERIFTPHALRHSFVTYLLRSGVKLEVVSRLANHSNINITLRYVKVAEDPIAEMLLDDTKLKGARW